MSHLRTPSPFSPNPDPLSLCCFNLSHAQKSATELSGACRSRSTTPSGGIESVEEGPPDRRSAEPVLGLTGARAIANANANASAHTKSDPPSAAKVQLRRRRPHTAGGSGESRSRPTSLHEHERLPDSSSASDDAFRRRSGSDGSESSTLRLINRFSQLSAASDTSFSSQQSAASAPARPSSKGHPLASSEEPEACGARSAPVSPGTRRRHAAADAVAVAVAVTEKDEGGAALALEDAATAAASERTAVESEHGKRNAHETHAGAAPGRDNAAPEGPASTTASQSDSEQPSADVVAHPQQQRSQSSEPPQLHSGETLLRRQHSAVMAQTHMMVTGATAQERRSRLPMPPRGFRKSSTSHSHSSAEGGDEGSYANGTHEPAAAIAETADRSPSPLDAEQDLEEVRQVPHTLSVADTKGFSLGTATDVQTRSVAQTASASTEPDPFGPESERRRPSEISYVDVSGARDSVSTLVSPEFSPLLALEARLVALERRMMEIVPVAAVRPWKGRLFVLAFMPRLELPALSLLTLRGSPLSGASVSLPFVHTHTHTKTHVHANGYSFPSLVFTSPPSTFSPHKDTPMYSFSFTHTRISCLDFLGLLTS